MNDMIPIRIKLKQFLSYKKETVVEFTGINLLGIVGKNGHGKSTLPEAVTYALFGETRYTTDTTGTKEPDKVVTDGGKEALVEFTFKLGDTTYHVERRRRLRGKSSANYLNLYFYNDKNEWENIGDEKSLKNTQQKLEHIINSDYETFTNSAVLMQDDVNAFTTMDPSKRRKVFEGVLGIDIYAEIQKLAIENRRELKRSLETVFRDIENLSVQIDAKNQHEADIAEFEAREKDVDGRVADAKTKEKEYEERLTEIKRKENQLSGFRQDIQERMNERDQVNVEKDKLVAVIAKKRNIVSNSEQILKSLNYFRDLQKQLEGLSGVRSQYDTLQLERSQRSTQYNSDIQTPLAESQRLRSEKQTLQRALDIKEECARRLSELQQLEQEHDQINGVKLPSIVEERNEVNAGITEMMSALALDEKSLADLKEKHRKIKEFGGMCPLTEASCPVLTEEHVAAHLQQLRNDGIKFEQSIPELKGRLEQANRRVNELNHDESVCVARRNEIANALLSKQAVERDYNQALEAENVIGAIIDEEHKMQTQLDVLKTQYDKDISDIDLRIVELHYDRQTHESMQNQFDLMKNEDIEAKVKELESIQVELTGDNKQLEFLEEQVNKLNNQVLTIDEKGKMLRAEIDSDQGKLTGYDELQGRIQELEAEKREVVASIGACREKIEQSVKALEQQQELQKKVSKEQEDIQVLDIVIQSCDLETGIPAKIIEAAVPEVEMHANELLASFGSNHRIEFVFERQNKTNQNIKSTFDINILTPSEEPRPFAGYSGGQKVFISLAVRLGLSYLLVKRAGSKFEFLALDESFSALDADNRQVIIQAVNRLRERFPMIWIISHLEEIKQVSDVLLEVRMPSEETGSEVRMIR